jgi:hypothetical protein
MHPLCATENTVMQQKANKTADKWTTKTGKAKTFTKSAKDCLLLHRGGNYYASARVASKVIRRSVETDDYKTASNRFPAVLAEMRGAKNTSVAGNPGRAIHDEAHRDDPTVEKTTQHDYRQIGKSLANVAAPLLVDPIGLVPSRVTLALQIALMDPSAASRYQDALTLLRRTYARAIEFGHGASNLPEKLECLRHKNRKMDLPPADTFALIVADISGRQRTHSKSAAMSCEPFGDFGSPSPRPS